jgi:mono/diheme cytochrome c family protein
MAAMKDRSSDARRRVGVIPHAAILTLLAAAAVVPAVAQGARVSARSGIYSADQRARGAQVFRDQCVSCHGQALDGSGQAPALKGPEFAASWGGASAADLFDRIQTTMPADKPGQLTRPATADLIAYILSENGFPAGDRELPGDAEALKTIEIDTPAPAK